MPGARGALSGRVGTPGGGGAFAVQFQWVGLAGRGHGMANQPCRRLRMNNLSNTSGIRLAFDELRHRRPFGDQPFWRRPSWESKFV